MKISNFQLAIGIPCTFPFIPSSFFYSFALMEKPNFIFIHADNGPIDTLRNDIVERALDVGASHLIMMDVDMIYHTKTITSLLSHKLPVVGALCFRRYPPFDSIMLKVVPFDDEISKYEPIEKWEENELVEVDATGAGCIMYDMEVFRKLPYPWFRFYKHPISGLVIGEDIGFCQDLKAAGYRIFVDTSVPCDHLTTMAINRATSQLYKAMKAGQEIKNAALGVIANNQQSIGGT